MSQSENRKKITEAFQTELTSLLNKHSIDAALNIPDYIISGNICVHLMGVQALVGDRDTWFGFKPFTRLETSDVEQGS